MRAQQAAVSSEEQEEMLRNLERRETEYMRLQRRKIGIDDFEQLNLIGKGAFGEVYMLIVLCHDKLIHSTFSNKSLLNFFHHANGGRRDLIRILLYDCCLYWCLINAGQVMSC